MTKILFKEGDLVVYADEFYYLWAIMNNEVILLNRHKLRPLFIRAKVNEIKQKDS